MIVLPLVLATSFAGLTSLCLSMGRHHAAAFRIKPNRRAVLALRIVGWAGILLAFIASGLGEGWNFGPVQWIGSLSCAALLVVLLMTYRPGWLRPMAIAALPLGLAAAFTL